MTIASIYSRPIGIAALCTVAAAFPAAGQGTPLAVSDSLAKAVLEQVKAPEGFQLSLFAAPPAATYPTCLTAAATGELFVCLDPNLSLDQARGKGRIVRLVDRDADGRADHSSVFADSVDSPRGLVFDGETLYVMHPPTLTALRDTDGDGVADHSEVLVRGLGFDLGFRGADHTTNGIEMGIDGWLYVAVGDYGFVKATGRDGTQLQLRGGGVVRVRPDGSDLEVYARGTRNIYDVAIDPFLGLFARDNTNDGQGWDVRLHYLPQGADVGYPALFANFEEEILPPAADLGAGAGTGGLWVHDPGFPEGFGNTLYTADWTLNRVFRHPLRPRGAGYDAEQEEFLSIPRPADLAVDGSSRMYVASLRGGSFRYAGDEVGFIVRVAPSGRAAARVPDLPKVAEARLVELIASPNAVHRLQAQRELLRRGAGDATVRRLEQLVLGDGPAYARVAAILTLKQLVGPGSHEVLLRAVEDPAVRAMALRALADRRGELQGVPEAPFVRGLSDPDPRVQLHAINGLARLGARGAAERILPLTASEDRVVSHAAVHALVELGAREAALRALDDASPAAAAGALRVLQRLHDPATVTALIDRVKGAPEGAPRRSLLLALARLYHRDAIWSGDWWTTKPSTDGPYYEPAAWAESARIRPVLRQALLQAGGEEFGALMREFARHRVLPRGADSLLVALTRTRDPQRAEVIGALIGRKTVDVDLVPILAGLSARSEALRSGAIRLLAAQSGVSAASVPLLRAAALDARLDPALRGEALAALTRVPGAEGLAVAARAYAALVPSLGQSEPLDQVWRRFVGERSHGGAVDLFRGLASDGDEAERVLGYSVLVQIGRARGHPQEVKDRAAATVEAAWTSPSAAATLVRAIEIMGAQELYADRLREYEARGSQE